MNDRDLAGRHHLSRCDRQMLTAAYLPVAALGTVLIVARTWHTGRQRITTGMR